MALPAFSFEVTVSANDARQDKIQVQIDHGRSSNSASDIARFLQRLGSPPRNWGPVADDYGRIFNRPRRELPPFEAQTIRSRAMQETPHLLPPPLFQGHLRIFGSNRNLPPWSFLTLLSLNPTRFLRHQGLPRPIRQLLSGDSPRMETHLFRREIPLDHFGEFALIESDNWLPSDRFWSKYNSNRFWPDHVRRYLVGAIQLVEGLRIATPVENRFNIQSVETYFEFACSDPIQIVLRLEPYLRSFAAQPVTSQDYPIQAGRPEAVENTRRLSIQTRRGEILKIYAKTNRRIRFEIIHELSGDAFRLSQGGHTFFRIEDALQLLDSLARLATERVNEVLNHFRLRTEPPLEDKSVLQLIIDIQTVCRSQGEAQSILEILVANSSLVVGRGIALGAALDSTLQRLVRRRILVSSNGRYLITSSYRRALCILSGESIDTIL